MMLMSNYLILFLSIVENITKEYVHVCYMATWLCMSWLLSCDKALHETNPAPSCLQLCAHGKTLLDALQTPVSSGSNNSITAKADYSDGATHVLDVVHEVISRL